MKHLICTLLLTLVLSGHEGAGAEETGKKEDPPLSVQLEGLAPEARITYLRYLLRSGDDDFDVLFQLGIAFHEGSMPDSAEYYYKRAIERSPELSKALVNLAVLYDGQERKTEALGKLEEAIALNPRDLLALSHAALMHFELGSFDRATEYVSRAIAVDPDHPQPHYNLAIFFWESGIYREAIREWQKVVDLAPDSRLASMAKENITLVQNAMRNARND